MILRYVMWIVLVTVIVALGSTASAVARAEVDIRRIGNNCSVILRGEITLADAEHLRSTECPRATINLIDSPGGDFQAAMEIGRWARQRNALTLILYPSYCYSSCALVFIGGATRLNQGVIGLHRPYLVGAPATETEVEALVPAMFEQLRAYVNDMGIAREFADVMINTPPAAMRKYRHAEIEELVPEYDPVYEEQEVARNARIYGISTEEYRQRLIEADRHCDVNAFLRTEWGNQPMRLYSNCKRAIYWGLSQSVYERRSKLADETCESLIPLDEAHVGPQSGSQSEDISRLWNGFIGCRIVVMQGRDWPEVDVR